MNGGIYNAALFGASQREARSKLDQMAGIKRPPSGILASSPELMQAASATRAVPQQPTTPPQQMPGTAPMVQPALPQIPMSTAMAPPQPAPRPMAPAPQPQPVQQPASPTTPMGFAEGQEVKLNRQNPKAVRQSILESVDITQDPVRFRQTMIAVHGSPEKAEDKIQESLSAVNAAIKTENPENIAKTVADQAGLPPTDEGVKEFASNVFGLDDVNDIDEINRRIADVAMASAIGKGPDEFAEAILLGLQNYKQTAAARAEVKKGSAGKGWLDTEQGKAALTIYTEQVKNNVPPSEVEKMMNEEMGGNIGTMVRMAVTGQTAVAPTAQQPTAAPKAGTVMEGYEFQGGDPADKNNWKKVG